MFIMAVAPTVTIVIMIVLGFVFRKDEIFNIARALQNKRAFELPLPIASPAPRPELPKELGALDRDRLKYPLRSRIVYPFGCLIVEMATLVAFIAFIAWENPEKTAT